MFNKFFFPIIDICLSHHFDTIAQLCRAISSQLCFQRAVRSAFQTCILNLHIGPHHMSKYGRHPICNVYCVRRRRRNTCNSVRGRIQAVPKTVWAVYAAIYGPCRWPVYTFTFVYSTFSPSLQASDGDGVRRSMQLSTIPRYTAFAKSVECTTPSRKHVYTTRSCTGRVQGTVWAVYTAVYGPCRWPVYTAVYVHGP